VDRGKQFEGDWARHLQARVRQNRAILSIDEAEDGALTIELPLRQRWFMQPPFSWVFPFRKTRRLHLDPLGAQVFRACSGEDTVESIIDWFAEREKLSFHESRITIQHYLRLLIGEGLVAIEAAQPAGA
jgi:hypothetical protein